MDIEGYPHKQRNWPNLRLKGTRLAQGLSFLALIVLSGKLYEVDHQVRFLTIVLTEWFPSDQPMDIPPPPNSAGPASIPTLPTATPVGHGGPPVHRNGPIIMNHPPHQQQPPHNQQPHQIHRPQGPGRTARASTERPIKQVPTTNRVPTPNIVTTKQEETKTTPLPGTELPATTMATSQTEKQAVPEKIAEPPPQLLSDSVAQRVVARPPTRLQVYVGNLKAELHFYALEMASARTTLILSVVFVLIFILSYWWMAFAIKQARENGSVSLRTILLLSVFAAVDIAASAGFVLLRIILYIRRDRLYPLQMRIPSIAGEYDQLAAYAALRMATLPSCSGSADILVSIVVGFLTGLRIYSVVCVFSYYRKAKNSTTDMYQKNVSGSEMNIGTMNRGDRIKEVDDYIPRPLIINYPKKHQQPHSTAPSRARSRLSSMTATGSTDDEEPAELKIQAADMPPEMQRAAVQSATQAIRLYSTEKHIAESIKQDFDTMYSPTWHCIVGRNWGSCVTHSKQCYVRIIYKDLTILLYKST